MSHLLDLFELVPITMDHNNNTVDKTQLLFVICNPFPFMIQSIYQTLIPSRILSFIPKQADFMKPIRQSGSPPSVDFLGPRGQSFYRLKRTTVLDAHPTYNF